MSYTHESKEAAQNKWNCIFIKLNFLYDAIKHFTSEFVSPSSINFFPLTIRDVENDDKIYMFACTGMFF